MAGKNTAAFGIYRSQGEPGSELVIHNYARLWSK